MNNCSDYKEAMSSLADGSADETFASGFSEHLAVCADCQSLLSEWRKLLEDLTSLGTEEPPLGLADRIKTAVREESPSNAAAEVETTPRSLWKRLGGPRLALAAAALLFVMWTFWKEGVPEEAVGRKEVETVAEDTKQSFRNVTPPELKDGRSNDAQISIQMAAKAPQKVASPPAASRQDELSLKAQIVGFLRGSRGQDAETDRLEPSGGFAGEGHSIGAAQLEALAADISGLRSSQLLALSENRSESQEGAPTRRAKSKSNSKKPTPGARMRPSVGAPSSGVSSTPKRAKGEKEGVPSAASIGLQVYLVRENPTMQGLGVLGKTENLQRLNFEVGEEAKRSPADGAAFEHWSLVVSASRAAELERSLSKASGVQRLRLPRTNTPQSAVAQSLVSPGSNAFSSTRSYDSFSKTVTGAGDDRSRGRSPSNEKGRKRAASSTVTIHFYRLIR